MPPYDRGRSTAYGVGLFTAVVGRPPAHRHDAWVWTAPTAGRPGAMFGGSLRALRRGKGAGVTPRPCRDAFSVLREQGV